MTLQMPETIREQFVLSRELVNDSLDRQNSYEDP